MKKLKLKIKGTLRNRNDVDIREQGERAKC